MANAVELYAKGNEEQMQELAVISQVAHMYYDLDMQQPEIAEKMFFSRSKVSRILKRARDLGIVEIKVRRILDRASNVEAQLKKLFRLHDAIVVTNFDEAADDYIDTMTDFAAYYVSSLLKGNVTIGISRGNTIIKVVRKLSKLGECNLNVVQLMGSTADANSAAESRELVNKVSKMYSGVSHYLNTPLYVDDLYAKDILIQDKTVRETFNIMENCDLLLTGVGGFDASNSAYHYFGYLTEKHIAELDEKGAVGSICARFFDINGQQIKCEWNQKCISMPFSLINRSNKVIGVAAGPKKALPILGALRGGLLSVLITDIKTAAAVIEQHGRIDRN